MKLYDISQEVFTCEVYPGDPRPTRAVLCDPSQGDLYRLSSFTMCAHNGTHVDAPAHFLADGATVEAIPLAKTVGPCYVAEHTGELAAADAARILSEARARDAEAARRILIKGEATVTQAAAEVFAAACVDLLGNESQSVGPLHAPMAVHMCLLQADVVLLEGVRLAHVPTGVYLLHAAPLKLGGLEGAPCRAVLIDLS